MKHLISCPVEYPVFRASSLPLSGLISRILSRFYRLMCLLVLLVGLLLLEACQSESALESNSESSQENTTEVLTDDMLMSKNMAIDNLLEAYPLSEFHENIIREISKVVGSTVTEDALERMQNQMSLDEIAKLRRSTLMKHFTKNEIMLLTKLRATNEGRSLLQKMPAYKDSWRQILEPVILESLSNKEESV